MAKLTGVVCLVFLKNNKFLLEQRLDNNKLFAHWTFTGGKIDEKDTADGADHIMAASIREADEETGLIPHEIEVFTSFHANSRAGQRFKFYGVWVKSWSGKFKNKEPNRRILKWIEMEKAKDLIVDNKVDERVLSDFLLQIDINKMGDPAAGVGIRKS